MVSAALTLQCFHPGTGLNPVLGLLFGWVSLYDPMAQRAVEEDPSSPLIYGTRIPIVHYQHLPSRDAPQSQGYQQCQFTPDRCRSLSRTLKL